LGAAFGNLIPIPVKLAGLINARIKAKEGNLVLLGRKAEKIADFSHNGGSSQKNRFSIWLPKEQWSYEHLGEKHHWQSYQSAVFSDLQDWLERFQCRQDGTGFFGLSMKNPWAFGLFRSLATFF
jgi:hypothetical protein